MKKRFLSVLLLLALALSLLPTMALAAGNTAEAATIGDLKRLLADDSVTTIRFTDHIYLGEMGQPETLIIDRDVTLDLNKYGLGGYSQTKVVIEKNCTLTIAPRTKGGNPIVYVDIENYGSLYGGDAIFKEPVTCYDGAAIYSGTFVGDDVHVSFSGDGTAYIYGGTFREVCDVGKIILDDGFFYAIEIPQTTTGPDYNAIYDSIKGGTFLEQFYGDLLRNAGCETGTVTFKISEDKEDTYCVVGGKRLAFQEYSTVDTGFIRNNDKYVTAWKYENTNKRFNFSTPVTEDITLVPASWEPYISYGITVSKDTVFGERSLPVTSRNYKDVFEDGTVSYNPETNVLTLKNAHLFGLFAHELILRLVGENRIMYSSAVFNEGYAIVATKLTVTGTGRLNIDPGEMEGQYYDGILIYSGGSYTQESGTVTISGNHAGIAGKPDWDEESANFALHFNGGTLICNLQEPVVNPVFSASALDGIVNLDVADGGKLTLTYNFNDATQKELTAPLTEEQKQTIQKELNQHAYVTQMKFEREVEVPDKPEEPEIPELPIGPVLAGGVLLAGDSNPFRDVRAIDWFYGDVMYAYEKGLMSGTAHDRFSPQDSFTRGMLLTILARHDGVNTNGTPWYQAGCDWALKTGVSDGRNPEQAISREEFAQILYRYAQYRGSHTLAGNDLSSFTDAASISSDALPAMQWAVAQAIIRGDSFRLNPQSGATRASACAMLHRFFVT